MQTMRTEDQVGITDRMDDLVFDGVCTLPEGIPCALLFCPELDCGDCAYYDDHTETVRLQ